MAPKIVVTSCVLVFGLVVPILEVNDTHVFNPDWPGHARLHEVWQLLTNVALAAVCIRLAWKPGELRFAAALAACVTGGFLAAFAASDLYGGSMRHTDGSELAIGGVNLAVLVMALATGALAVIAVRRGTEA